MFFFLSKILDFLITPILWVFLLLLIGVFKKDAIRQKRFLFAGIITLYFFSNSFIFDEFMRQWEVPATPYSRLENHYDAGIIMSGMINYDLSFDRIQFNRRNDRLMQAIELYKSGRIKKFFFTGGSGSLVHQDKKEALMVQRFLTTIGIPLKDVIIESESNNTHENALFSKIILEKEFPAGRFLLITSASHMRRSIACFQKEGIAVTPYSVDRQSGPRKFQLDHLLIPSAETLFNWNSLIHEWVGMMTYKLMGFI